MSGASPESTPGSAGAGRSPLSAGNLTGPDEGLARALRGEYRIRVGDWLSRGWTTFSASARLFIGFAAIRWVIFVLGSPAWPVWFILAPMFQAGFLVAALKTRRGEKVEFADFWLGFNDFGPLFLAGLVSAAFMIAGLCTCGIVTIYLWVGYQFVYLLVVDRRMDFWEALEASRRVANRQWLGLFGFVIVLFLMNLVAWVVTLSLGLIVTAPLTACVLVEAYADIFGVAGGVQRVTS